MRIHGLGFSILTVVLATSAAAQSTRIADSLLREGQIAAAESLYYAATSNRPSDASARRALGNFLIARGAPRVGATLLEEAIRFGGDKVAIERDLAATYLALGDYHVLAALTTLPTADKDRAKWLIAHETRTIAPDSLVWVGYRASTDTMSLGRLLVRVNGRVVDAAIVPSVRGIVVSDAGGAATLHLHVFPGPDGGSRGDGLLAAADSMAIGGVSMRNVPVTITHVEVREPIAIGLDALGKFSPTFEPKVARIALRVGVTPPETTSRILPTLAVPTDFLVLETGGWSSIGTSVRSGMLRDHTWTLDARRGRIVVDP